MSDLADFAQVYLSNDWSVIPILPDSKKPALPWKPYQDRRATPDECAAWFANGSAYSLGIVTGAISGLTVLDCDSPAANALAESHGLPPTWTVKTGRGWHYYFEYAPGSRNFQKRDDLPGIDLRSDGGYVVAPPSKHASGVLYDWAVNSGPLADLPAWVLASKPQHKKPVSLLYQPCAPGERNDTLARLAGFWMRLGDMNQILYMAHLWNLQNTPPLPWAEVVTTLTSIWQAEQRTTQRSHYGGIVQ